MLRRQSEGASRLAHRPGGDGMADGARRKSAREECAMVPLSILDLVRVTKETAARGALDNARDLAAHAEGWGYRRVKPKAARGRRRQVASRRARPRVAGSVGEDLDVACWP